MKRTVLHSLGSILAVAAMGQTTLYMESFELLGAGTPIASTDPVHWAVWPGGTAGGAQDADVTDSLAHIGTKSLSVIATSAAGGTTDLLLKLGNKTSGQYSLAFWMYIPAGKGGYFNIQTAENATPGQWALDMVFRGDGTIRAFANNDSADIGLYPFDTWFSILIDCDMDIGTGTILVNGTDSHAWDFTTQVNGNAMTNRLGSINFYAFAGGAPTVGEYYIDDILYLDMSTGISELTGAELVTYPNPTRDELVVELPVGATAPVAELVDASGRRVRVNDQFKVQGGVLRMEFDLRDLPEGLYTLRVISGSSVLSRQITKS